MLRLPEEILLLMLNEERGEIMSRLAPDTVNVAFAGAILMDLALEGGIDSDLEKLVLVDASPLDDALLDPFLEVISQEQEAHDTGFWVRRLAEQGDEIRRKVLDRLIARGILASDDNGSILLSRLVSRARRYPVVDDTPTEHVRLRIMRVLFGDDIPDPRDIAIICLADACGLFASILDPSELAEARERIDIVSRLDLIGQSVSAAVREASRVKRDFAPRRPKEIPRAKGLPLVGNGLDAIRDLRGFLTAQHRNLGPIFQVQFFNRRYIAMVGPAANLFVARGNKYFRNFEHWLDFNSYMGSHRTIISMDGGDHLRMRREQAKVYSHKLIENRLDEVVGIARREIAKWPLNRPLSGQYACQRIIVEQLGLLATSTSPRERLDDIIVLFEAMLGTFIFRNRPRLAMSFPRVRRARRRVDEFIQRILDNHLPENRRGGPQDYIDELLELQRGDPQFLAETDLPIAVLGPFFVGLDTAASTNAFMLYILLKHPELLSQFSAETRPLFESGSPTMKDFRRLDVTRRIAMETLRKYPLGPVIMRVVANSFEFEGYTVPAGSEVLIGITVPHLMQEYFPDPERFDIDRFSAERAEHRRPGVYAPFGVGAHQCLGRSMTEVLLAINLGIVANETKLILDPPDYELKTVAFPVAHPDKSFKFRIVSRNADI
ncbi:MAG: cytochrome P450 [Albidovulum sp.]|nr:cytochrome P450 [Albidovulum sp.]